MSYTIGTKVRVTKCSVDFKHHLGLIGKVAPVCNPEGKDGHTHVVGENESCCADEVELVDEGFPCPPDYKWIDLAVTTPPGMYHKIFYSDWDFAYVVSDKTLAELGEPIVALTNTAQLRWGILFSQKACR